ncbi:hypothetical protein V5O48_015817 [Marasmius crinis-equi]|uniref:Uncharacterized protein n=1 Tax=Marasmius crinis-equi TaxID=585013 RepID=A0ABR3ETE9_9AGAR
MSTENESNAQTNPDIESSSAEAPANLESTTRDAIEDIVRDVVAQSLSVTLQNCEYDLQDLDIFAVDWSSDGTFTVLPSFLQSMCTTCEEAPDYEGEDADAVMVGANDGNGTTSTTAESAPVHRGAAPADVLVCPKCGHSLKLPPPEERWYAIWRGRRVGWCKGWKLMDELTRSVKGQQMSYQLSADDARAVFAEKLENNEVEVVHDRLVSFDRVADGELFP